MQTVAVIDYGMSNLRSVAKALEFVAHGSARIIVSGDPQRIAQADRVVFPGQGAIGDCMRRLHAMGLVDILRTSLQEKPFLGICLGLQSLLDHSAEDGGTAGLGLFAGEVRRFPMGLTEPGTGARMKIPHMGWNQVHAVHPHPLWRGIDDLARFYFVHSYYVDPVDRSLVVGETDYGVRFAAALARDFVFATQFHPEKSQRAGLKLLENFLTWSGGC
jgi:imidazole glycerol-phosphate synthase subunit HisH